MPRNHRESSVARLLRRLLISTTSQLLNILLSAYLREVQRSSSRRNSHPLRSYPYQPLNRLDEEEQDFEADPPLELSDFEDSGFHNRRRSQATDDEVSDDNPVFELAD